MLMRSHDCVIFSIGSNNQFEFEELMATNTQCRIETFDCTVEELKMPSALIGRVQFHKICIGPQDATIEGKRFMTYGSILKMLNIEHVSLLKMDIEGYEFDVLYGLFDDEMRTGVNLPYQISLEVHWQFGKGSESLP